MEQSRYNCACPYNKAPRQYKFPRGPPEERDRGACTVSEIRLSASAVFLFHVKNARCFACGRHNVQRRCSGSVTAVPLFILLREFRSGASGLRDATARTHTPSVARVERGRGRRGPFSSVITRTSTRVYRRQKG